MTDAEIIEAVRKTRTARLAFKAAEAAVEQAQDALARARELESISRRAYGDAMQFTQGIWNAADVTTDDAIIPTPEQTGKATPPMDIHDVLASGVIPGTPGGGPESA